MGGNAVKLAGVIVCGTRVLLLKTNPRTPRCRRSSIMNSVSLTGPSTRPGSCRPIRASPFTFSGIIPRSTGMVVRRAATRLEQAGASACVYGHLHTEGQWRGGEGVIGGVRYYSVAADAIGFRPLRLGSW